MYLLRLNLPSKRPRLLDYGCTLLPGLPSLQSKVSLVVIFTRLTPGCPPSQSSTSDNERIPDHGRLNDSALKMQCAVVLTSSSAFYLFATPRGFFNLRHLTDF